MCEDFANKFAAFILENKFHDKGGRERQREIVSRYFALFTETYSFKIIEHLPRLSIVDWNYLQSERWQCVIDKCIKLPQGHDSEVQLNFVWIHIFLSHVLRINFTLDGLITFTTQTMSCCLLHQFEKFPRWEWNAMIKKRMIHFLWYAVLFTRWFLWVIHGIFYSVKCDNIDILTVIQILFAVHI